MEQEVLRTVVWEEMLAADMRANYFGELVLRYQRVEKWLRIVSLLFSSAAFASVVSAAPNWLRLTCPAAASLVSLWLLFNQYGSLSRDAADLHFGWRAVHKDYERLWNDLDSPEAEGRYHQVYDGADALSKTGTRFPNDESRLGYWLDQAAEMALARYAH